MQLASSVTLEAETRQLQLNVRSVRLDSGGPTAESMLAQHVYPVKTESTKQRWDKVFVKIVKLANIRAKPRNLVAIIVNKILMATKSEKTAQLVAKLVSCIYPLTALPVLLRFFTHCPVVPLSRCPVVPLSRCPVVLLSRCPVVPLSRHGREPCARAPYLGLVGCLGYRS